MNIYEIAILMGFSIMAGYLMWIHYHLLHKDFRTDFFIAIKKAADPIIEGLNEFYSDSKQQLEEQREAFTKHQIELINDMKEQRILIQDQMRLLKELENMMRKHKDVYDQQTAQQQEEITALKLNLGKTQNLLDKCRKKEAQSKLQLL